MFRGEDPRYPTRWYHRLLAILIILGIYVMMAVGFVNFLILLREVNKR